VQLRKKSLELALEVVYLKELEPKHLRVDRDRMIASTGSLRLVNEIVRFRRLLGDGYGRRARGSRVLGGPCGEG
jgi:hypothetical protein